MHILGVWAFFFYFFFLETIRLQESIKRILVIWMWFIDAYPIFSFHVFLNCRRLSCTTVTLNNKPLVTEQSRRKSVIPALWMCF